MNVKNSLYSLAKVFGIDNPLFVVGGAVRNSLLRLPSHDVDICGSLPVEDVKKLLKDTDFVIKIKSKDLNTCEIICGEDKYEYATFRKEFYDNLGGHTPTSYDFNATIVEDVVRRDFTCNSLYYHILDNRLIDFFGGEKDIKDKVIKTVATPEAVLSNDGVRVLRLVRFASEFNFTIDKDTYAQAEKYKDNLNHISSTYKREEFLKIIYANLTYQKLDRKSLFPKNRGYNGIKLLDKLNLWSYFGKDTRLANIRGVGSYLNCFLKSKLDPLEAFSVDCYFYLKNSKIVQDSKDFIDLLYGDGALCLARKTKKCVLETLIALDKIDKMVEEYKNEKSIKYSISDDQKTKTYLKAIGGRRYLIYKKLLSKAKK